MIENCAGCASDNEQHFKHSLSSFIRYCTIEGNVIILNLRTGSYQIFDHVASDIWALILGSSTMSKAVASIVSKYGAERNQAQTDILSFVKELQSNGLIDAASDSYQEEPKEKVRWLGDWYTAIESIYKTRNRLLRIGFPKTYLKQCQIERIKQITPNKVLAIQKLLRIFRKVENLFPAQNAERDCLHRSLALHRFLVMSGVPANHIIGVKNHPFGAHAWVQIGDDIVNDCKEFTTKYVEISKI